MRDIKAQAWILAGVAGCIGLIWLIVSVGG